MTEMTSPPVVLTPQVIQAVTDMHAVYRMFGRDNRLLYIGSTRNAGTRLGDHSTKWWFCLVATITLEWYPTELEAREAETQAIATELPRYNQIGIPAAESLIRRPSDVRRPLIDLLVESGAQGISGRRALACLAANLPGVRRWEVMEGLNNLRSEGITELHGAGRAARWRLADGDLP